MSDTDKARLESCVEHINETLGNDFSRLQVVNAVLQHNFNAEEALNQLLESQAHEQQNTVGKVEKGKMEILLINNKYTFSNN